MTRKELRDVLKSRERSLNGGDGKRANLSDANLSGANLSDANLRDANLIYASLRGADLSDANLSGANLSRANLSRANLKGADLRGVKLRDAVLCCVDLSNVDLSDADICSADLGGANLHSADLSGTDMRSVNLRGADLSNADLSNIVFNEGTAFYALQCPEEGSFIGYKKAHGYIVKLEILAGAKRSSATSRKCRCSAAKVLSITAVDGSEEIKEIASDRDSNFIYRVGEIVRVNNFDENRWNECSTGIHFFITRREAEQYGA